ncbi:hypothetical protein LEP1GSC161_2721 [Leptospira santarosai str. CBC1416]|uniref:Uncharacterized protein n=1 Tax=Leptospira santarosai str. CBC1416 TaxID=1193059 RepID=M6VY36_9LEPT|nr:hypothetical protein LEP1GSC161_2721 [Leptospira santarosai str. CBC1416]
MLKETYKGYTELPRGGYLIDTSEGYLQIGSPPETIKDTMGFEKKLRWFLFCRTNSFT